MKGFSRISLVATTNFLLTSGSWMQGQRGGGGFCFADL
jgi:transcriptional regulator CtsR